MMWNIITVGIGGFIGSVLRYLLSGWVQTVSGTSLFPYGTFCVNVGGCFFIGILGGWAKNMDTFNTSFRLFLIIGLLGGFTTFSTFSYETMTMIRDNHIIHALANIGLQIFAGLVMVWLGYGISSFR